MPFMVLSIIIQILLVVHIVKTGRNTIWIWLVVLVPLVGSTAYVIVELLPSFLNSHKGQKAKRDLSKVLNRNKEFNDAVESYNRTDTVGNTEKLAFEYLNKQLYSGARELFLKCLNGAYQYDPKMMLGLAQTEFGLENHEKVSEILNTMMDKNPDFEDTEAHLLYARAMEGLGDDKSAHEVYEALESYGSTPEVMFRHAMLLRRMGDEKSAQDKLQQLLRIAQISGKHHRSLFKEWISLAKRESKT